MKNEALKKIENALKEGKAVTVHYFPEEDSGMKSAWEVSPGQTIIQFTESGKLKKINRPLLEVVRDWDPLWTRILVSKKRTLEYEFDELV